MKVLLVLVILCAAIWAETVSYEGYKVFQINPKNEEQLNLIRNFESDPSFDFWSAPRRVGLNATVMVSPTILDRFVRVLNDRELTYSVMIEDVESTIAAERTRKLLTPKLQNDRISFTEYARYDEIQEYLAKLAQDYPDIVTVESAGTSYEGRSISLIKISTGGSNKPIILLEGGIHAREWISPAFVTYLINQLVENEDNRELIQETDWYIIPVLNPDGYEYTHTTARLWRKTVTPGINCNGVDGNRNFDFHWMETGASSNECAETYAGPSAFSESETAALRDVVLQNKDRIKLYLSIHSYGNYLLYPWGFASLLPDDADELHALAVQVDEAIASVYGTRYTIGSSTNVLYAAAGASDDWVKGVGGVELSYTVELPGGGVWGFDLPASRILDVGIETFEGLKVYQRYIVEKFVNSSK